jgi:hypothetical protein
MLATLRDFFLRLFRITKYPARRKGATTTCPLVEWVNPLRNVGSRYDHILLEAAERADELIRDFYV